MGNIILEFENLPEERIMIPESEPLVFDLFNTPKQIKKIINNTNNEYYVRLFTDEFYINIDPNANYNLKLSEDSNRAEKYSINVKTNIFHHGIVRKSIDGLRYNEMIYLSDSRYTRTKNAYSRCVTRGEELVDEWYSNMLVYSSDVINNYTNQQLLNFFHSDNALIFEKFLQNEQKCTNKINKNEKEISKCKEKTTDLKEKPDPKSSSIWWTILYLTIILIITKLIFGSIPYIVVTLVIGTFMLEMQYGDGFSRVFMYIFYLLLPTMITLFVIKSVFGISGSPDQNNPYNQRYNSF